MFISLEDRIAEVESKYVCNTYDINIEYQCCIGMLRFLN